MSNKFKTATKEINGKKYTAQFNGIGEYSRAMDRMYIDNSKNISLEKLSKYCLDNVIVKPKISLADFSSEVEEKTRTINGVEYTARFSGILTSLRMIDSCYIDGSSNTSMEKTYDYLFKNVIVNPANLTADDFDTVEDLSEVVAFATEVMQGGGLVDEFNKVITFAREVMDGSYFRHNPVKEAVRKESAE